MFKIKFRTNIDAWIEKEIHGTEIELLRAEDDLAAAKLRRAALAERLMRLKGKQARRASTGDAAGERKVQAIIDRARKVTS